jgi:hypothetical protein
MLAARPVEFRFLFRKLPWPEEKMEMLTFKVRLQRSHYCYSECECTAKDPQTQRTASI